MNYHSNANTYQETGLQKRKSNGGTKLMAIIYRWDHVCQTLVLIATSLCEIPLRAS
jgi:hypothetical protein